MSAHKLPKDWLSAPWRVADPGTGGTFNLDNKGRALCPITTTTTETRTIPAPDTAGQYVVCYHDTDAGNVTITITGGQGISSVVSNDAGDAFALESITVGGTAKWIPAWSNGPLSGFPQVLGGNVTVAGTLTVDGASTLTGAQTFTGATTSTGRITTTDGVASGTAGVVGRLLYSNTAASTAIASTSAETVFDTNYNMPANTLKAGTVLKIRMQGIGTTVVGSDTLAYKLYIGGSGGTALITSAATAMVNSHTIQAEAVVICRTAGATGTFVSTGTYKVNSAEGTMVVKDDIVASTTINTTAAQLITATATFNTTNANSIRMDIFVVEIY